MGNNESTQKLFSFEDVQSCVQRRDSIIIHTLPANEQRCLINGTISAEKEEDIINDLLKKDTKQLILIYGKHCNDTSVESRYNQLISLGFQQVYMYKGGIFEWLLLQDIYGHDEFPTTIKEMDILKYKPPSVLNTRRITNG